MTAAQFDLFEAPADVAPAVDPLDLEEARLVDCEKRMSRRVSAYDVSCELVGTGWGVERMAGDFEAAGRAARRNARAAAAWAAVFLRLAELRVRRYG